ncbi:MAG: class I SAM-dependent methyltransferase [Ginsengibacter sp.]
MRDENVSRFSNYKNISKSDFFYLVYIPLIRELKSAIVKYAKGKVIDIGCGNKPHEKIFEEKITEYIGCDIVQSSLQKVDILCEANNIPLPNNSFDTAFSTQTIEHVEDHQGLVNEAYRLIKPGGFFIVSGPMYWHLHEEPYDFFRFTKYGFKYIFEKAGFEMVEINPNGGTWATTGQSVIHSFLQSKSRNFFIHVSRFLFHRLRLYWLINAFFSWLDKVDYNPLNTMNYVVVGKKPSNN